MSSLIERLNKATADLLYPSESDYPLEPFVWKRSGPADSKTPKENSSLIKKKKKEKLKTNEAAKKDEPLAKASQPTVAATANEVLSFSKHDAKTQIEEISLEDFFSRVTKIEDWFGDEEKETAQKFSDLQKLFKENLKEIKVFRVGQVEIDVYVVGVDADGNLTGVKTTVVET